MHPILATLHLGGTEVVLRAYGTFMVLAWVVAVALGTVVAWRKGISWWRALIVAVSALVVGVVGARLLDLGVNWTYYAEETSRIYGLGFRGFALYGGFILALIAGLLLARAFRLPAWRLLDSAVPALAAGVVLMRVGCFLNGCCFGKVTSLPWGVTYPVGSPAWAQQFASGATGLEGLLGTVLPVHPTQIYETITAVVLGVLAVWLMRRRERGRAGREAGENGGTATARRPRTPEGVPFLAFALGFTAFRALNHQLRAPLTWATMPGWVYPTLYGLICAGIVAILVWRARARAAG